MNITKLIFTVVFIAVVQLLSAQPQKHRVIILADMGHDPDEEQQIVHMMVCSNEFDLEGLITVTGRVFNPKKKIKVKDLRPHLFHQIIDGYEKVYPNLQQHATGYQSPDYLRSIISTGQTGNGMADTGVGKTSKGAQLIIDAVCKNDPRPLHIIINAGSNTLAQALINYKANHSVDELDAFIRKLRVFENGGQDEAGAWICHNFPQIHWVKSTGQNKSFGGPSNSNLGPHVWQPFPYTTEGQHEWAKEHIQTNHGALGALYPDRFVYRMHYLEGGGTVPWLSFTTGGLTNPNQPSWGGFSGRYSTEKQLNVPSGHAIVIEDEKAYYPYKAYTDYDVIKDKWLDTDGTLHNNTYACVWRWRKAMWNDLQARMDWCVQSHEDSNHHPKVVLNGDSSDDVLTLTTSIGRQIELSAKGSTDPDNDSLSFKWWLYPEAGEYPYHKELTIINEHSLEAGFIVPNDARGKHLHIILEVWDNNSIVRLAAFRRVIIKVE